MEEGVEVKKEFGSAGRAKQKCIFLLSCVCSFFILCSAGLGRRSSDPLGRHGSPWVAEGDAGRGWDL